MSSDGNAMEPTVPSDKSSVDGGQAWRRSRYVGLAAVVLALAAFNLGYRLDRESVGEWDESLYATSAWEMLQSGNLAATTFDGRLDYSNSKPPLQTWLVAASFRLGGINLLSLRAASAVFAWLTVLVLMWWVKRVSTPLPALLAGLVLATSFGSLHLHAGRSGNPDALLTLLLLGVVVVLWASHDHPWRRVWLGPLLAGVFLLKGPAVLMPLAMVVAVELFSPRAGQTRWRPYLVVLAGFALPVSMWAIARWRVDGWRFFQHMMAQDLVALSLRPTDERGGSAWYYLDILQKYSFDWLAVAAVSTLVLRHQWRAAAVRAWSALRAQRRFPVVIGVWAVATVLAPSALQTKVVWYLNPFYPLFALGVGWLLAMALGEMRRQRRPVGLALIATAGVLALLSAEGRTLWRLLVVTNLDTSVQGVLLSDASFRGRHVHRDRLQRAEAFVVRAMLGGRFDVLTARDAPLATGVRKGDLLIVSAPRHEVGLRAIGEADGNFVYEVTADRPRDQAPPDADRGPG
jgi:4-amino-4-deoxy-L-arabinose transferase-like glycosyltransferase